MIPRDPGKRIRIRRCLFALQALFLVTKILVSVLVTGDFISLVIQCFAILVFLSYVPWALVCDFRTAKEVRLEWERIRRIRRGEEQVGESTLEKKGKKNRWRSDRAWQECLFLTLQGLCWLLSAIFAGIQGGPTACQQVVLENAIISGLDHLVPDRAAAQFCDGMTANIALSCIGVVFTALWLWWVYYSVRTLRKFEKTTKADGEEVLIVREKVWRKSMARLLRRDEDDDVNGIKRIVTGGLVDLVEMESRRSVNQMRSISGGHSRGDGTANGTLSMGPGLGLGPSTPRPSHESDRSSTRTGEGGPRRSPISSPGFGERRDTEAILQSLPQRRGDMPPPPYMGQPQSEGTNTQTLSSSGEGTATSQESPGSHQALLASTSGSSSGQYGSSTRPLPLAPPEVDRVVERKMDEMATGTGTSTGTMDAFTATRLGLGPAAQPEGKGAVPQPRSSTGTTRLEDIVDQKLDTYSAQTPAGRQATAGPSGSGGRYETMEQLVDRKIALGDGGTLGPSSSSTHQSLGPSTYLSPPGSADRVPHRYSSEITASPINMHAPENTSTWPGTNPPPHFSFTTPPPSSFRGKGKAAEAGFSLDEPDSYDTSSSRLPLDGGMTLEQMIERKMAAMRASRETATQTHRPQAVSSSSGESQTRRKSKGKRKGRARAGSDPGPKLQRHDETDEEESGEG